MSEEASEILAKLARLDEGQRYMIGQIADALRRDEQLARIIYGGSDERGLLTRVAQLEQQLTDYAQRIAPWRLLAFTIAASVVGGLITYIAIRHVS